VVIFAKVSSEIQFQQNENGSVIYNVSPIQQKCIDTDDVTEDVTDDDTDDVTDDVTDDFTVDVTYDVTDDATKRCSFQAYFLNRISIVSALAPVKVSSCKQCNNSLINQ